MSSILKAHSHTGSQGDSGSNRPYLFWNSDLRTTVALPIDLLYQITFGCIVCRQRPINIEESYIELSHHSPLIEQTFTCGQKTFYNHVY